MCMYSKNAQYDLSKAVDFSSLECAFASLDRVSEVSSDLFIVTRSIIHCKLETHIEGARNRIDLTNV
jgi:hypothetical protein